MKILYYLGATVLNIQDKIVNQHNAEHYSFLPIIMLCVRVLEDGTYRGPYS